MELDTARQNDRRTIASSCRCRYWLGSIRWHLVRARWKLMGFVPFGMERATLDDKQKIRKMLEYLGITHPAHQVEFLSALLGKPFNTTKMSRQDFMTLRTKIKNIQTEKDKA
jgi:hypothetical protein